MLQTRRRGSSCINWRSIWGSGRLHDVIRAYLAQQQAANLPHLHHQFLSADGLTNWADLPADEPYLWYHLAYHRNEAGLEDELRTLLLSFRWLEAKLSTTDINTLLADAPRLRGDEWLPDDKVVQRVARTLRQAGHVLAEDKSQLAGQLLGRLLADQSTPIQSLLAQASPTVSNLWLRPLAPSLQESSALIRPLQGHTSNVNGVAVTPDGRLAISASCDNTLKVREIESGQELHELRGHRSWVNGVAVTPDGRLVISASDDGMLKVFSIESGQLRDEWRGHTSRVTEVAVAPDGRLAISASDDGTLKVWDMESGQLRDEWRGHTDCVTEVAVAPDGRLAITASRDCTLKVWDIESRQLRDEWRGHKDRVYGMAVTGDGRLAITASRDCTLKVFSIESGQLRDEWRGHRSWVKGVAVTADGRWALSVSWDYTVKVWSLTDRRVLATFDAGEALECCAVTPDGVTIVAAGWSGRVHFLRFTGYRRIWGAD